MHAEILGKPETFDRVDRVKHVVGEEVLPNDDCLWILGGPFIVKIDGYIHVVPRGFTTDGASIPGVARWATGWQPWDEPQRWGAIAHDWLYCVRGAAKHYCDLAFRAVLGAAGSNLVQRNVMYLAVRVGGGNAYTCDQRDGPKIYT